MISQRFDGDTGVSSVFSFDGLTSSGQSIYFPLDHGYIKRVRARCAVNQARKMPTRYLMESLATQQSGFRIALCKREKKQTLRK